MNNTNFKDSNMLDAIFPKRHIKRVLFIDPPDLSKRLFKYRIARRGRYHNYPLYGVGCLATHLRNMSIDVSILNLGAVILGAAMNTDENGFDYDKIVYDALHGSIDKFKPDIIGITLMFAVKQDSAQYVCSLLSELYCDIPIVLGGVHVSTHLVNRETRPALISSFPQVRIMFMYEAEESFTNFIKVVNREADESTLSQIVIVGDNDLQIFDNKTRPSAEKISVVPAHDLMPPTPHGKIGGFYFMKKPGTLFSTIYANRGCRGKCTFCGVRGFNGKGVRSRSIQSIIDELLLLQNEYNVGHVMWLDDDFLYDQKRTMALFNEIVRKRIRITWDCSNGVLAPSCTNEIMKAAEESGCIGLCVGVETGNPDRLKKVNKPGTREIFAKAAEALRRCEMIHSRTLLMIGFPGETFREILDTISIVKEMNLDWNNVNILQPLVNTPLFNSMVQSGIETSDHIMMQENLTEKHSPGGVWRQNKGEVQIANKKYLLPDLMARNFNDVFANIELDRIPNRDELDDIWAYMNFYLNFKRLEQENRRYKLFQQTKYLQNISEISAPENAFALYYYGYLYKKITGRLDKTITMRLKYLLSTQPYWQARFNDLGLSLQDLLVDESICEGVNINGVENGFQIDRGWLPDDIYHADIHPVW